MAAHDHVSAFAKETIVLPAKSGSETRWLLLITALIVTLCATAIYFRTGSNMEKTTETWQINAFSELNRQEIGVFNSLLTAALEIGATHDLDDGYWLNISELEEFLVPPFVKDAAWSKQGKIEWDLRIIPSENRHIAMYKGIPANDDVGGAFLLLMLHEHKKKQGNVPAGPTHAPFEIWFHEKAQQKFPDVITDQALISAGWREVVALTGEDEVTRMKGKTIQ